MNEKLRDSIISAAAIVFMLGVLAFVVTGVVDQATRTEIMQEHAEIALGWLELAREVAGKLPW